MFSRESSENSCVYVLNNKTWNAASYGEQKIEPNIVNLFAFRINHSKNYNDDTKKNDKIKIYIHAVWQTSIQYWSRTAIRERTNIVSHMI